MKVRKLAGRKQIHEMQTEHEIFVVGCLLLSLIEAVNISDSRLKAAHIAANDVVERFELVEIALTFSCDIIIK